MYARVHELTTAGILHPETLTGSRRAMARGHCRSLSDALRGEGQVPSTISAELLRMFAYVNVDTIGLCPEQVVVVDILACIVHMCYDI
jgi:hypothetical protein